MNSWCSTKCCMLETCSDFNWKVYLFNPSVLHGATFHVAVSLLEKITVNPMSQTVIPKGILSVHQNPPSPDKTQSLVALTAPRLWQIWFEKARNKNEHRCSSLSCPRWVYGAALCAIWSTSSCKWIKKIQWFSPPSVRAHHTGAINWNVPKSLLPAKVWVNFWAFNLYWLPPPIYCPLSNSYLPCQVETLAKLMKTYIQVSFSTVYTAR